MKGGGAADVIDGNSAGAEAGRHVTDGMAAIMTDGR